LFKNIKNVIILLNSVLVYKKEYLQ
jgi:hypothetical protein